MPVPCDNKTFRITCKHKIMKSQISIVNTTTNTTIASRANEADTFFLRLRGLLGRKSFKKGEALLIPRCQAVHSFFMKFPIDIVFVGADFSVIRTVKNLKQFRISSCYSAAYCVIELPAGTIEQTNTKMGDKLALCDINTPS